MKTVAAVASLSFVGLFTWLATVACNRATFDESPDAQVACNVGAHPFCTADAAVGCTIGPNETDPHLKQLPQGSYQRGCVVNFVDDSRDPGGDCVYNTCVCDPNPDGGDGQFWNCH